MGGTGCDNNVLTKYCAYSTKPLVAKVVTPVPPLLVAAAEHVEVEDWLRAPVHGNVVDEHAVGLHAS
jgi:hypothetical protein